MSLPPILQRLRLPVIGAPMFIAGNPKLAVMPVAQVVAKLETEYAAARRRLQMN